MYGDENGLAPRGSETILLVEPEPETRKLALFMLCKAGYTVLEARNAIEACEIFEREGGAVDLLFTEAPMSRVNGHELARMLCARNPALRVLFLADVDYARLARRPAAERGLAFMQRPFTSRTLADKVRQTLDAPRRRVASS